MFWRNLRVVSLALLVFVSILGIGFCQTSTDASTPPAMTTRSGEIVVKVNDFAAAREQIVQELAGLGAQLVDAKTAVTEKGGKHGWLRVQLPAERLPEALPMLRGLGKLYAEKIDTQDDTSNYESLARRIDKLQQHQGRLSGILGSERRLRGSDILYIQDRLYRASVDESMLSQQREDIARTSQLCTLTITLFEPTPTRAIDRIPLNIAAHFASAKEHALGVVDRVRARTVTASAYALVFAPVWVPLLILAIALIMFLVRLYRRLLRPRLNAMGGVFMRALPERFKGVARSLGDVASAAVRPSEGGLSNSQQETGP